MKRIMVEVVRVKGPCGAKLKVGDRFRLDKGGMVPTGEGMGHPCLYAFKPGGVMDRTLAGLGETFSSCIDAGYGQWNANVVFRSWEEDCGE